MNNSAQFSPLDDPIIGSTQPNPLVHAKRENLFEFVLHFPRNYDHHYYNYYYYYKGCSSFVENGCELVWVR